MPRLEPTDRAAQVRAQELRARIKEAGLTLAEFGRRAGFGRGVVWRLARGGVPSREQQARINSTLKSEGDDREI